MRSDKSQGKIEDPEPLRSQVRTAILVAIGHRLHGEPTDELPSSFAPFPCREVCARGDNFTFLSDQLYRILLQPRVQTYG